MKCAACDYEHNDGDHDEKFDRIIGNFVRKIEANYGPDMLEEVSLRVCPKCGTVRMERH